MMTKLYRARGARLLAALLCLLPLLSWAGMITVNPTSVDVGTVGLNAVSPAPSCYTAKNTGRTDLKIIDVTGSSAEFVVMPSTVAGLPAIIPPGGSYPICVQFKPTTAGGRTTTLGIQSDDRFSPLINVTATGYGGIEQFIALSPAQPFEIELGQGASLRAKVTFDNGATGVALLNWNSTNASVASATAGEINHAFGIPVSTGSVTSLALGDTTITVAGVANPAAKASVAIRVTAAIPHEFMATAIPNRVVRVKNGQWSLCYDFPEVGSNNLPLYSTNQIGVTTPSLDTIGDVYVTAVASSGTTTSPEEIFFLKDCSQRTTVYNQPTAQASFRDLVVDSRGNAVVSSSRTELWQVTPTSSFFIPRTGLPVSDVGALAIDSFDNLYVASGIQTASTQAAAVYVHPFGTTAWFPIAVASNALPPSSMGIRGLTSPYEGNKLYAMNTFESLDKTIVERYTDLNGDGSFFKLIGGVLVPDLGEMAQVARIDAGVDLTLDSKRSLVTTVAEPQGNAVVRLMDKNNDGDFLDIYEYRVIFQSNNSARLKDVAFASPCPYKSTTPVIIPLSGTTVDIGERVILTAPADDERCGLPQTYVWTKEDVFPPEVISREKTMTTIYWGLPAIHKIGLKICDTNSSCSQLFINIKVGPPKISGVWPNVRTTNSLIFIFGKNFKTATGAYPKVCFNNGTLCTSIVVVVDTGLLFAIQPAGVISSCISVETPIGKDIFPPTTCVPHPPTSLAITGLWPSEAKAGSFVFVFGTYFSTTPGQARVDVNGTVSPLAHVLDPSLLVFLLPTGASTGPVHVTVGGSTATSYVNLGILP